MPAKATVTRPPSYRLHKPSGRAVVRLNGRDHYLGDHGSDESKAAYDRLIGEWLASGRRDVKCATTGVTVAMLCDAFADFADRHYVKPDGSATSEVHNYVGAIKMLAPYADTLADDYGPLALKATREAMIRAGWSRKVINRMIGRVRRVFRWGVSEQLVNALTATALESVDGLLRGRTEARETAPIGPVADHRVDAIRPYVSDRVWAMIEIQRLTAARAGEVVTMTRDAIDATGNVWIYKPVDHKTAHHGIERRVYIGQQAQRILAPYMLNRPGDKPLFSPAESEAKRLAERSAKRRTPMNQGNRPKANRAKRKNPPAARYSVDSYRRAIYRGCDRAFVAPAGYERKYVKPEGAKRSRLETDAEYRARLGDEKWAALAAMLTDSRWHPHQLRHSAITRLQREYGIEKARIIAGHASVETTGIYVEADQRAAIDIMAKVG